MKRQLRILAEKYNHNFHFEKRTIVLKGVLNAIKIKPEKKDNLIISCDNIELTTSPEYVFDIVIRLFEGQPLPTVKERGELITLALFFKEEGKEQFWREIFNKAVAEEKNGDVLYKDLGGNRILVDYCSGFLIFRDDLCYYSSNVIKWN